MRAFRLSAPGLHFTEMASIRTRLAVVWTFNKLSSIRTQTSKQPRQGQTATLKNNRVRETEIRAIIWITKVRARLIRPAPKGHKIPTRSSKITTDRRQIGGPLLTIATGIPVPTIKTVTVYSPKVFRSRKVIVASEIAVQIIISQRRQLQNGRRSTLLRATLLRLHHAGRKAGQLLQNPALNPRHPKSFIELRHNHSTSSILTQSWAQWIGYQCRLNTRRSTTITWNVSMRVVRVQRSSKFRRTVLQTQCRSKC